MKHMLLPAAVFSAVALLSCPAFGQQGGIQMLPPTPLGSNTVCPSGTQQILSYSGTPVGGAQGGINCVPIQTDAYGNMAASGFIQVGNTNVACAAGRAGAIRFNAATYTFEGCNGTNWQALGGGTTLVVGGCLTDWAGCPAGYRVTSYFSPGTYNCCDKCGNPSWKYTVCSQ